MVAEGPRALGNHGNFCGQSRGSGNVTATATTSMGGHATTGPAASCRKLHARSMALRESTL
eukprot:4778675-Lingulodinium_polyedra.AAC.1